MSHKNYSTTLQAFSIILVHYISSCVSYHHLFLVFFLDYRAVVVPMSCSHVGEVEAPSADAFVAASAETQSWQRYALQKIGKSQSHKLVIRISS